MVYNQGMEDVDAANIYQSKRLRDLGLIDFANPHTTELIPNPFLNWKLKTANHLTLDFSLGSTLRIHTPFSRFK